MRPRGPARAARGTTSLGAAARGPLAALAWLAFCALASSCAIDTELGLDASVDAARVTVSGVDVSASLDVTYRVGPYAEGDRLFAPQAVELFVGDALIAQLTLAAPPGFDPAVAPGQARTATLTATASGVDLASQLCEPRAGGAAVTVLFRWIDQSNREIGSTDAVTTDVTC